MVAITVKDTESDRSMILEVTDHGDTAEMKVKFEPPLEGEHNDLWGILAGRVLDLLKENDL
jgi:hypothetical protein